MNEKIGRTVAVAGATGRQGGAVALRLLESGFRVRGLTRNPGSPAGRELARHGADMVKCDLDDAVEVRRALEGAWGAFGAFAMSPEGPQREEQQATAFAQQARSAGVQHYVYSSVASAHRSTGIPHFENKWRVETAVRGMGFPSYTILRPAFFMENFMGPWLWPGVVRGKLAMALNPMTKIQMIAVEDIGSYGLLAFEKTSQLNSAEIELAGDELSMPHVAAVLSDALGWNVRFEALPIEEIRAASRDMALMYEWFDRVGLNVDIEGLKKRYALQPKTFAQWTAEVKWPVPVRG